MNLPGLLLFADFEKAFDSISHNFMFNCLKCFDFGSDVINWIKCYYNDAKKSVINSQYMTDLFNIRKAYDKVAHYQFIYLLYASNCWLRP